MSFTQRLKIIENLMAQDTERCLQLISERFFVQSLFYRELKAFVSMFEGYLQKKTTLSKSPNDGKAIMRDQLILGFYSVIIMRSSVISMRHEQISTIATKADQFNETIFNSKLAVENLMKIYKKLEEGDQARQIIAGLLLQIRGFSNYKLIVKDLSPLFVSEKTFQMHFQNIKNQCPNLLEVQLNKYKVKWGKYLRFKPLSFENLVKLFQKSCQLETSQTVQKWDEWRKQLQTQTAYMLTRISLLNFGQVMQKLNIDQIVKSVDDLSLKLTEKLKETAIVSKKSTKLDILINEYDLKQFIHKNYLSFYLMFLKIINKMISSIGKNWFRKIKWLHNLVINTFINFNIKSTQFHESIALQYSQILVLLVKMITNFFITFGAGMFSNESLSNLVFNQEYSISKLIQALLYNEYPFDQAQVIQFQNYQKQRRHHQNKHKQSVIDIVNFNMKSLNINLHWDSFFIKIIPNLKNSIGFAQEIIHSSLYFILKYFQSTQNFQPAAKFLLMLYNAKNSTLSTQKKNKKLIEQIKASVYPQKKDVKQGIQYFCEEYFAQYLKINKKRLEEEQKRKAKVSHFSICRNNEIKLNNNVNFGIKKTESRQDILQGWDNFESVKDNVEVQASKQQNVDMVNSQMFYSIKDSVNEKEAKALEKDNNDKEMQQENEILLPQF